MAAGETGKFLPQHHEEIDALFSIYADRVTVLSGSIKNEDDRDENSAAAAAAGGACAVLKVLVPLNFADIDGDRDCVIVESWLDDEPIQDNGNSSSTEDQSVSRPTFERSESGRRLYCQFSVIELPPVELVVILLPDYPDEVAPDFVIFSPCLNNAQKTVICKKLDELAAENAGLPIILTWMDWLQNECLKVLRVTSITLSPQTSLNEDDCRIGDSELSVLQRIEAMLRYDVQAERRLFRESDHDCPVCFDGLPGTEFYRIDSCRHYCCRACLLAYVQQGMQDGKVQFLKCPVEKCDVAIPVPIIRALLSDEEWRRWETLALSRALDTMGDLDWCPRCRLPVVCEEDHQQSHLARCAYCFFAFCTQCKEAWHQSRGCASLQEKLESLGTEKEKSDYEKRMALQRKLNILSTLKVKEMSKPCPTCRVPIEKNFGCNKIFCTNCNGMMCYKCGKKIDGYEHFNQGSCPLTDDSTYEQIEAPRREPPPPPEALMQMEAMLEADPELRRHLTRCPACRQRNLKLNRNNHMRCWACHTTFCYLCRQRLVGAMKTHFSGAQKKCPQHSDD